MGYSAFARHYLRNHNCFLFLRVLRCFSSPRSLFLLGSTWSSTKWVTPFGNLRINGRLHLPEAYRSLPRPSSPPRAKASTVRSFFLFLNAKIVVLRLTRNPSFYLHCELIFFLLVKNLHRLLLNNLILAFTLFQYVKDHWEFTIYELRFTILRTSISRGGE